MSRERFLKPCSECGGQQRQYMSSQGPRVQETHYGPCSRWTSVEYGRTSLKQGQSGSFIREAHS